MRYKIPFYFLRTDLRVKIFCPLQIGQRHLGIGDLWVKETAYLPLVSRQNFHQIIIKRHLKFNRRPAFRIGEKDIRTGRRRIGKSTPK
ncbi:hypothetical protein D3C87_1506480 [compost metagenome]